MLLYKREQKTQNVDFEDTVGNKLVEQYNIINELEVEYITGLIQNLPDKMRLVFNMYIIEGYSHQEIATHLNISEGTSKSHLHDAFQPAEEAYWNEIETRLNTPKGTNLKRHITSHWLPYAAAAALLLAISTYFVFTEKPTKILHYSDSANLTKGDSANEDNAIHTNGYEIQLKNLIPLKTIRIKKSIRFQQMMKI